MHRRQLLKMMSLAGAGTLAAGTAYRYFREVPSSYFLITAQPEQDRARLMHLAGVSERTAVTITAMPIQPAAQDLSILHDGKLLDPVRTSGLSTALVAFTRTLRARPERGHTLLTLEPKTPPRHNVATIAYNGVVVDQLRLDKTYRTIDVPGAVGPSTLRLQDGKLRVVASSCRHGLCKKMGAHATGTLVCAPNKLVVTLPQSPGLIDALTG